MSKLSGHGDQTKKRKKKTRPTVEIHGQILPADITDTERTQPDPVEAKEPMGSRDKNNINANDDKEKSGGGPPLDATKRERGTGTSSDAGSRESSSTSKGPSSSEDTTPPTVVLVVPGTGWRYNKSREAAFQKTRATPKKLKTPGATKTPAKKLAEKEERGDQIYG